MPDKSGKFSHRETAFVTHYVKTGDATYAAAKAGYPQPASQGGVLLRREAVGDAIRSTVLSSSAQGAAEGLQVLRAVAADKSAKTADRVNASGKLVSAYIRLSGLEAPDKALHELSASEIREALSRIQIELKAVDVTPDDRATDVCMFD